MRYKGVFMFGVFYHIYNSKTDVRVHWLMRFQFICSTETLWTSTEKQTASNLYVNITVS